MRKETLENQVQAIAQEVEKDRPKEIHYQETQKPDFETKKLLRLSPSQVVEKLTQLEEEGQLESFLEEACDNPRVVALLSYWEKWLEEEQRNLLEEIIAKKREVYKGSENPESLPLNLEDRFSEDELKLICSNLGAIQLTFGCSKGCPFCGFDALPGVREYIPYSQLLNLFKRYGKFIGKAKPTLYWASEPADYKDETMGKTYQDVHQLAKLYANYSPHITSSKIDPEWLNFLGSEELSYPRISVFGLTPEKIEEIEHQITAENLTLIGRREFHKRGIGISFLQEKEKLESKPSLERRGIGCINGLLLTPRGLYNVVQYYLSEKLPQGQYVVPFEGFSKEGIQTGMSLPEVLSRTIVRCERFPDPGNGVELISPYGHYRVFFDENGIITEIYDYEKIEKEIKDNFGRIYTEFVDKTKESFNNINWTSFIFADLNLLPLERRIIIDYLKNINLQEIGLRFVRHNQMEIIDYSFGFEIPELENKAGKIWCSFSYDNVHKKILRLTIFTDAYFKRIKDLQKAQEIKRE